MKHQFPFIGAGYGQYFEWFEMYLIFEKTPDEKAKKAITACAPPIDLEMEFNNNALVVFSEQFVNVYIQRAYDNKEEEAPASEYECTEEASDGFEEDLNRWLLETHKISPILVAYRPEDWEAGGTDLSNWHNESAEMLRPIIKSWVKNNARNEDIERVIHNAMYNYFMDDSLALTIIENYLTPNLFLHLLQDKKHGQLLHVKEVELGLLKIMPNLTFDNTPFGAEVILYAIRANSDKLKNKLQEVVQNQTIENIQWINHNWYKNYIARKGITKEISEAYWIVMDALEVSGKELTDLTVYNNIVAACSKESHQGVSEERMRKAILIGKKYAVKNPLMYWATFNIQCELNMFNDAIDNVKKYFKSNDPNKEFLASEIKKKDEYAAFRATSTGAAFVKKL